MPNFTLSGTVVPFGNSTSVVPLDLSYEVRGGGSKGFFQRGVIQTRSGVPFSETINVPADVVPFLSPRSVFIVSVFAYAPVESRQDVSFLQVFTGDSAA